MARAGSQEPGDPVWSQARIFLGGSMRFFHILVAALILVPAAVLAEPTITEHVLTVDLNPKLSFIEVTDGFHVEGLESSSFRFRLNGALEITSMEQDGNALRWHRIEAAGDDYPGAVEIEVNLMGGDRKSTDIRVTYNGVLYDSLQPPDSPYARSFEQTSGLIGPEGAFLSGSTCWIPTIDGSLFKFRLLTRVPSRWESVSQGDLEGRTLNGATRTTRWKSDDLMEEVYLVAGPYLFDEAKHGDIDVLGFFYEADDRSELWNTYLERTKVYLDQYASEIGDYPFSKFAVVENFWQTGFGMPSFTLLGDRVIRLPFIPYTSYRHEILHNWWGNGVYVDWEEGNWCEGLTSYGADHAAKEERGESGAIAYRRGELQKYRNYVQESEDFPLNEFRSRSSASTQAVGYSKSTMVFHMLRRSVGDVPFAMALKRFYRDRTFQVSSWDDIRRAFEEETQKDLASFFRQWVERRGAPVLSLSNVKPTRSGDRYAVEVELKQEEPYYQLEVPVWVETEGDVEKTFIILDGRSARYEWKGAARPLALSIDPEFDIFRKLYRDEIPPALSQTMGADSTLIVLGEDPDPAAKAALRELADSWAAGNGARITTGEVPEEVFRTHAVWLLGETAYHERFLDRMPREIEEKDGKWRVAGADFQQGNHSLVVTAAHPENPELSWSLFLPANAGLVPSIGRKIPHYGKYGYLVFEDSQNVAKGEWPSGESPMKVRLEY